MTSTDKARKAGAGLSLKVRLTLWYGIALGVILTIFAGSLDMVIARN